jgi:tetratricopeptide (TPR) repeat protein
MERVLDRIDSRAKEFPAAYVTTGDFCLRVGEGGEAIRHYRQGIAADKEHESLYQKRIVEVLMRQGDKTAAAEINNRILKKTRDDTDARSLRASLLLDKGEVQASIAELESLIAAAPKNYVTRYNLARAYAANGDYRPARQRYTETIEMRPDYIPARVGSAQLLVTRGEYENGLQLAMSVLKIDKTNAQAQFILSDALLGMKRPAESDRQLQNLLQANAKSPDVLYQAASAYLSRKNYKEAEAAFRQMQAVDPADPRGLLGIKEIYVATNHPDKAIELLQSEVQKSPGRPDYHMALGNTLSRAGKYDLAIAEYSQVASGLGNQSKGASLVYFRLGEAYRLKGDLENAIVMLQRARKAQPDSAAIAGSLGQALDSAGRKREAKQNYEDCLSMDRQNGMTLNNLAFLLSENNGDLDQALTYAQAGQATIAARLRCIRYAGADLPEKAAYR